MESKITNIRDNGSDIQDNFKVIIDGEIDIDKQTVYLDVDDVIINSSEVVVDILNQKYRLPHYLKPKTVQDVHSWDYKSIGRNFNLDDINLFVSDDTENIDVPDDIKIKYIWLSANTGNRNVKLKDRLIMLQKAQEIYEDLKASGATKYTIAGVDYELNNLRDYVTRAT